MKRIFVLSLLFILNCSCFASEVFFSDMENHWAKDIVYDMCIDDTIGGYDDGTFKPEKEVSIQEFLKILITQENYELNTNGKKWPDWYINTALDNGLISQNDFKDYSAPITRLDACKIISKYIGLDDVSKAKANFSDLSKENKELILKLVNLGVINGFQDNTFRENDTVTRAQACKIINQAYNAKNDLINKRAYKITSKNSNIGEAKSGDVVKNRYDIKNKRILINDSGRYGNFTNQTLNPDYIDDELVIKAINALVDDYSYTEVIYVPDKYTINTLNICYGERQDYVNNGIYSFQVRFFENNNYNVKKAFQNDDFCEDAFMKIELDKMWDKSSQYDGSLNASDKNLNKLKKLCTSLFGKKEGEELVEYLKEKLVEASNITDNEFEEKFSQVKIIGKYTFNVFCSKGQKIMVFVKRPQ